MCYEEKMKSVECVETGVQVSNQMKSSVFLSVSISIQTRRLRMELLQIEETIREVNGALHHFQDSKFDSAPNLPFVLKTSIAREATRTVKAMVSGLMKQLKTDFEPFKAHLKHFSKCATKNGIP